MLRFRNVGRETIKALNRRAKGTPGIATSFYFDLLNDNLVSTYGARYYIRTEILQENGRCEARLPHAKRFKEMLYDGKLNGYKLGCKSYVTKASIHNAICQGTIKIS